MATAVSLVIFGAAMRAKQLQSSAPRLFGISATKAPIVAIVRRGPSDWSHVGAWFTDDDVYESGAWLRGTLYPQKCDLSPDGRWLAYSAMKHPGDWPAGQIYEAISRLPWLTALAAWNSGTTYTRGIHFVDEPAASNVGDPDVGDATPCLRRYGLQLTRAGQFSVEHRRGWVESVETPPRGAGGHWDEKRLVEMVKDQPGGTLALHVDGAYAGFRSGDPGVDPASYWLSWGEDIEVLEDVQWADWDERGRLLVATFDGRLQVWSPDDGMVREVASLAESVPEAVTAPDWATEW
jgi:hypothetical protein